MATLIDDRLADFDGALNDCFKENRLSVQLDAATRYPGNIEHVVHEVHHCAPLPLNDAGGPVLLRDWDRFRREQISGGNQRCKWIAQLMAEHGQKFVFLPVGDRQLFGTLAKVSIAHTAIDEIALS